MGGYAAAMRIERIEIGVRSRRPLGDRLEPGEPPSSVPVIELAGTQPSTGLGQRLDEIRIHFGQLTWYLFNAEGWR